MPSVSEDTTELLRDQRIGFLGPLAGMSRRDASRLVREQGGKPVDPIDASVTLLVVGEKELVSSDPAVVRAQLDEPLREAAAAGRLRLIYETELWQRLGLVEQEQDVQRLYTPAMLAELLGVPVAAIRRWHRRGWIVASREVRRLAYFDFAEVAVARLLAQLVEAGCSLRVIDRKLGELDRRLPEVPRPLATLPFVVEGRQLLLRHGDELAETSGQLLLDFDVVADDELTGDLTDEDTAEFDVTDKLSSTAGQFGEVLSDVSDPATGAAAQPLGWARSQSNASPSTIATPSMPSEMIELAVELADDGQIDRAVEAYRAALVAGGPDAETNFQLAELLYRNGDLTAARERYFSAIELDEDYVEARANLGCVLAETGERELAVAAFQGALSYHGEYPDVHYHLARTLDELGRSDEAMLHWQTFLTHAPDSPWAETARDRLRDT